MVREYEGWSNERVDDLIKDRKLKRLGEVQGWRDPVLLKCLECGHEYSTTPNTIKMGSGCPVCAKKNKIGSKRKAKYTLKEVKSKLAEYNLTLLSEKYQNSTVPLTMLCNKCEVTFLRPFISILRGSFLCPNCRENVKGD